MKDKNNDLQIIEQFLDGTLSESEQTEFEKRLKTDTGFSKLYRYRTKLAYKWEEANNYARVKTKVVQLIEQEKKKESRKRLFRAAAIIILLISLPGILIFNNSNKNTELASTESQEVLVNQPESKASINYYDEQFKLISPIHNQSFAPFKEILFTWNSSLDIETALIIKDETTDSITYRISVKSSIKKYKLDSKLEKGSYTWQLEGFKEEYRFTIQ